MSIPFICCCNQCCTVHTEWVGQLLFTRLPSSFTLPTLSQPLPLRCYYCTIAKDRGGHVRLPIPHSPPSTHLLSPLTNPPPTPHSSPLTTHPPTSNPTLIPSHHSPTHLPPHTQPTNPSLTHSRLTLMEQTASMPGACTCIRHQPRTYMHIPWWRHSSCLARWHPSKCLQRSWAQ